MGCRRRRNCFTGGRRHLANGAGGSNASDWAFAGHLPWKIEEPLALPYKDLNDTPGSGSPASDQEVSSSVPVPSSTGNGRDTAQTVVTAPRVVHCVERVSIRAADRVRQLQETGVPVVITDAMPLLTGTALLDFMPLLVEVAGNHSVTYEKQSLHGKVEHQDAPLQLVMNMLDTSEPGCAYFLVSDSAMEHPRLSKFTEPPVCCKPD